MRFLPSSTWRRLTCTTQSTCRSSPRARSTAGSRPARWVSPFAGWRAPTLAKQAASGISCTFCVFKSSVFVLFCFVVLFRFFVFFRLVLSFSLCTSVCFCFRVGSFVVFCVFLSLFCFCRACVLHTMLHTAAQTVVLQRKWTKSVGRRRTAAPVPAIDRTDNSQQPRQQPPLA